MTWLVEAKTKSRRSYVAITPNQSLMDPNGTCVWPSKLGQDGGQCGLDRLCKLLPGWAGKRDTWEWTTAARADLNWTTRADNVQQADLQSYVDEVYLNCLMQCSLSRVGFHESSCH